VSETSHVQGQPARFVEFRLQKCAARGGRRLCMPTPQAKIARVQRLSAEERLRQPAPEEWLRRVDETQMGQIEMVRPSDFELPSGEGECRTELGDVELCPAGSPPAQDPLELGGVLYREGLPGRSGHSGEPPSSVGV